MSTHVKYGTGGGVDLYWTRYEPTSGTTWPAVVELHPGGYKTGGADNQNVSNQLVAAGFLVFAAEYRLAPPAGPMLVSNGHPSPGQDTVGDTGHYPKQTTDVQTAIRAARADPKCNGLVYCVGGSAGASHSLYMAATGTKGDDMPDLVVACSPGVSNLADLNLLALPPTATETNPYSAIANYVNIPYLYPTLPSGGDLAALVTASPVTYFTDALPPIWGMMASMDSLGIPTSLGVVGQSDVGPVETLVSGGLKPHLLTAGLTESTAPAPELGSFKISVVPTTSHKHAFEYWNNFLNGSSGQTVGQAVITWLLAGPPAPAPKVFKGALVGITHGAAIDPSILADPNVDAIGLNLHWNEFEHVENTYDFASYLVPRIKQIFAAGKKTQITVATMGGSEKFGGNTPNWVFTAIGNTVAGRPGSVLDGATTNASPTVTAASGNFSDADLHQPISGTNIPGSSYVGIVNSPTSIGLSSSPTLNTPVNATGTLSPVVLTLSSRPRVAFDTHDVVPGATYTYNDKNPQHGGTDPTTTIPVYWEPTYLAKKRKMLNALGNELTHGSLLTAAEKASIVVVRAAYANAQTEDWAVPYGKDPSDPTIDWTALWLNSPTAPIYANRGAGYTTKKFQDAAITDTGPSATDAVFADGQTFTNKRLVSSSAAFMFADVGKTVSGTNIEPGTKIASWTSPTEVQLDTDTTGTGSSQAFTVKHRSVGLIDIAVAAFPNSLVETAIAANGPALDAAAAAAKGDADVSNFLPRSVAQLYNSLYPGRVVTTKNQLTAISPVAPPVGTSDFITSWKLLYDIVKAGGLIAAQDLGACVDPNYRMNGGSNTDKENIGSTLTYEQISDRAATHLATYGALYREMYDKDAVAIPGATKFTHDLLTGGIVIQPPPPEPGVSPPFQPIIRSVNFTRDTIDGIAALLQIDSLYDLPPAKVKNMVSRINQHVRYAWRFYDWPELVLTEERAFRQIWNADHQFAVNDEVFYLPDGLYYRVLVAPPPGQIPPSDTYYYSPITLSDFYIAADQPCRMAIGDILGVYDANPRTNNVVRGLNFRPSSRGLDVGGASAGTAFVRFRIRPSVFTHEIWSPNVSYKAGDEAVFSDGQCYRALSDFSGFPPTDQTRWMLVPMPEVINDYVVNRTAADMVQDVPTSGLMRLDAQTAIEAEVDKIFEAGQIERYDYSGGQSSPFREGVSGFWWSVSPPYVAGGAVSTLTDVCLDQWGNVVTA